MSASVRGVAREAVSWVVAIAVALLAAFLIRTFVMMPFVVPSGSMEPTIQVGDSIFAQKVTLELGGHVQAGDIVVFHDPEGTSGDDYLVKRVVATGGQTVDLRDGAVYVDGVAIDEPYASGSSYPLATQAAGVEVSFPYTVPEGSVWVMGDNRGNSADSRYFGAVGESSMVGIAFFRYWPLGRMGTLGS